MNGNHIDMSISSTFKGKTILITGGTGTIGIGIASVLLKYDPASIRLMTNDENSLDRAHQIFADNPRMRFLLGDIRDRKRLMMAMTDVDIVFHAAALKHVYICEYNPFEAVQTNIDGIVNLVDAALANGVQKVIFTSSDKAVNPSNMMGASKLLGEKLVTAANFHKGKHKTVFSSVRFGNVLGSRGSVIPLFKSQIDAGGPITITDGDMTRFVISLDQAVNLVFKATECSVGGETFVLKMDAIRVKDLVTAMGGNGIKTKIIGPKPGEKMYEELMTEEEMSRARDLGDMFAILPGQQKFRNFDYSKYDRYPRVKKVYTSHAQKALPPKEIKALLEREGIA